MALHFELVSPSKLLFSGDVESVVLPGTEGEMTILPEHAPLLTSLRPGMVTITASGTANKIFVRGGFAEVNPQGLTVLAETAITSEDMNTASMADQVKSAEGEVAAAKDDEAKRVALENLEHVKGIAGAL
jgi:F-type H+-transporting ATPase subunit epsilon